MHDIRLNGPNSKNHEANLSRANLKFIGDLDLVEQIKKLVESERKIAAQILIYFQGIESRRIYAARGYTSMHEFVVEVFKYSDGVAHRRIGASRLLNSVPQKISNTDEKNTILAKIKNQSSR